MKRRVLTRIALLLALALLSASALLATADVPDAGIDEFEEIELAQAGEGDEDVLDLGDGALVLDDGLADALDLDGLPELRLSDALLSGVTDEAALAEQSGAAAADGEVSANLEGTVQGVTTSDGMDNDALFEAWLNQVLPSRASGRRRAVRAALSGRASLDGVNLNLYDALVPMIKEVASGTRTSTQFAIDVEDVGLANNWWSAEQLGLASLEDDGLGSALLAKEGFDSKRLMLALLADCPYDLYWYDKVTGGMGWSYGMQLKTEDGVSYVQISSMTAKMAVAKAYSKVNALKTYEVNDLPARVSAAVANINAIVADNAGKDDLAKVKAYANAICRLVEYNHDAADDDTTPYGDPWQLVYIFDGDDDTNVVCEGYSKGFKYLCDLSDFDGDVACELMSGSIPSGAHMWNALRMPDGRCYLVDLTNSDGGSSCNEKYFLKGCTNQTATAFTCGTLTYTYNENTLATYSEDWRTMSQVDYGKGFVASGYTGAYDGEAHGITVTPGQASDTVTYGVEKGVYDSEEGPTWKDAGTYTVYFRVDTGASGVLDGEAKVVITPKSVDLDWSAASYTYDGNPHAPTAAATGLIPGDTCEVTVSGAQKNIGAYTATATALSNGNYALPDRVTQPFDIAPRAVGVNWSNTAFTYDGNTHAPTATATGLISGDTCEVMVVGGQVNAGSYTAMATVLSNDNYMLSTSETQDFTIAPKAVGVDWSNTAFTYDGNEHAPTATATGLVSGDTCAVTVSGGQVNAGSYTATATGVSNANYVLSGSESQAFTIAPKAVGLSWTGTSLTYNGKAQAPTATATGLASGDTCAVTVTGGQVNAGSYTATASALSNGNYVLPGSVTQAFSIAKKTVGLNWSNTGFTYDRNSHIPTAMATGLISGDSCAVTVTGGQVNAGSYTATASALSNGNYALPQSATQVFTIAKKTVGLNWTNTGFTYDGNSHIPTAAATGLISGDTCSVTVSGGQVNAGSYTATASALSNSNYALPESVTQAFTVAQKTVGLSWTKTSLTYNGKSQKPTATATGLISGDTCAVTVTGGQKNAGSYTATASALSNANYALPQPATRAFTIAKKTVGLKWTKTSLTYNGKTQKPKATATGLVKGDKCTVTVTGSRKNAGSYTAKATKLSNANYALPKARTKACTIKKKTITLKWTKTKLKYNGKAQKPTATAIGLIKGDKCKVTVSGAKKKKGTYTAKAAKLSNKNYQLPAKATVKFKIY